uniref:Uncharacterized protein n=1 Tax=Rhodopseudomonas palustris (strain BisA53) TaxID=316055 RepID=Q07PN4_RHOP5
MRPNLLPSQGGNAHPMPFPLMRAHFKRFAIRSPINGGPPAAGHNIWGYLRGDAQRALVGGMTPKHTIPTPLSGGDRKALRRSLESRGRDRDPGPTIGGGASGAGGADPEDQTVWPSKAGTSGCGATAGRRNRRLRSARQSMSPFHGWRLNARAAILCPA